MDEPVAIATWYFTVEGFENGDVAITKKGTDEEETVELLLAGSPEANQFVMMAKMMGFHK